MGNDKARWVSEWYLYGLMQNCSISIAKALEILQSCTKPSVLYCSSIHGLFPLGSKSLSKPIDKTCFIHILEGLLITIFRCSHWMWLLESRVWIYDPDAAVFSIEFKRCFIVNVTSISHLCWYITMVTTKCNWTWIHVFMEPITT